MNIVATAVAAVGSPGAQAKRGRSGGGKQGKGLQAVQQKKPKAQHLEGVRGDGAQGWKATGKRKAEVQGGEGICDQGEVVDDRRARFMGDPFEVRDDMLPGQGGDGPKGIRGLPAYLWDPVTGLILDPRDARPTCSDAWLAAQEELEKDEAAVEVAADICSGTQSMKPVYRHRKKRHAYVALDEQVEIYSAAQQKTVQNTRYDIMEASPEETMVVIVLETKRLKKKKVERIKLEEVWISVPCKTYSKTDYSEQALIRFRR